MEILGAGRGRFKGRANATSAVEAWGVPPVIEHILIENSAYNGKLSKQVGKDFSLLVLLPSILLTILLNVLLNVKKKITKNKNIQLLTK